MTSEDRELLRIAIDAAHRRRLEEHRQRMRAAHAACLEAKALEREVRALWEQLALLDVLNA